MSNVTVPVLIAGGGPVGLAASICLSRFGVRSLLVEQNPTTTTHPKATVVNTRTFELFRQWGIESRVRAGGLPPEKSRYIVWATSLTGFELGRLDLLESGAEAGAGAEAGGGAAAADAAVETVRRGGAQSPTFTSICPQDVYEPILRDTAESYATADVRFHTRLESFRAGEDGVDAVVTSLDTGRSESVRARHLLACDGAASPAREQLGIAMVGPDNIGSILNVYFHADLRRYIAGREGALYWIVNPDVPGVFIALDNAERWLLNTPLTLAPGESIAKLTAEECRAKIRRAVGDASLSIDIRSIDPWIMRSQVAERYRAGSVFLLGDAAHRFPPTGGFGMNTGVQDAHNLAWKIAGVLRGWADPKLLDTYEIERRPVAQQNADQSYKNARRMPSSQREGGASNPLSRIEEDSAEGAALRDLVAGGIRSTREHFSASGQTKGFVYASPAIAMEEALAAPEARSTVSEYRPSASPGSLAPHCWIRSGGEAGSLLDLFDERFVLLTGPKGERWARASASAESAGLPPLAVHAIGDGVELQDATPGDWCALYGVEEDGAVLVRPDGHVAWRARSAAAGAESALREALALAVGRAA